MQQSGMKNGLLSSYKLFSMFSMDTGAGAAQVTMSDKIPVTTVSAFAFNSFAAIVATSARANVTTHFFWVESNMIELKRHSLAAAVIPAVSGESIMPI